MAMLWSANEDWLAQQFPPNANETGQSYSRTKADMALAGELVYWTGGDADRAARLMRQSGLARDDEDWLERKVVRCVERACENAKQYAFMAKAPPDPPPATPDGVSSMGVTIAIPDAAPTVPDVPAAPVTAVDAALLNIPTANMMDMYFAFHPNGQFIHRPTGALHVSTTVDLVIGKDARMALVPARPVHALTWAPGYPERFQFRDIDVTNERAADSWLYNTYAAPKVHKTPGDVKPWVDLIERLYPDDAGHLIDYFSDAAQNADRKCNHAVVLGSGTHGIGKDTLLAPVRFTVGEKNFRAIKPSDLVGGFNPWVATRILQVSESRDLGEGHNGISRYDMYERCKDLCAAPPTMLECNAKYTPQSQVLNVLRLILTTNHRVDGIYLPPEDRRHYCAWSDAEKLPEEQALAIYAWYEAGGMDYVAHWLMTRDISHFNRAAPPPQTPWWHELVEGGRPAEDERFADALTKLGNPEWTTLPAIGEAGGLELAGWMSQPGNRRKVTRELERAGYRVFVNPAESRGRWYVGGTRTTVYRRKNVREADLFKLFGGR
jgi:hypothetical protein